MPFYLYRSPQGYVAKNKFIWEKTNKTEKSSETRKAECSFEYKLFSACHEL